MSEDYRKFSTLFWSLISHVQSYVFIVSRYYSFTKKKTSKRLKVLSPETVNIETLLEIMAKYLTIIPRARVGSESIAGRMGG